MSEALAVPSKISLFLLKSAYYSLSFIMEIIKHIYIDGNSIMNL